MYRKSTTSTKIAKHFLRVVAILAFCLVQVKAQKKITIGDNAPPLAYSKWIQGPKPITALENDKTYVIEFWATWCGPCIAAMPHLSELAKKYEGKIEFIGCDVWENLHGGNKDQESYLPKVTAFVQDQFKRARLTYNVIADNTAEDMGNKWLKAAGLSGIPSSFVINKGKIAWIGHPHYLDSILVAVNAGTYYPNIELEKKKQLDQKIAQMTAGYTEATQKYKEREAAKDYTGALKMVDEALAKFPDQKYYFVTDKFMLLLNHFSEDKAIAYGKELQAEKLPAEVLIGGIYEKNIASKKVNEFAANAVEGWKAKDNPKVYDILATFQSRTGNHKAAAASQQMAVDIAKKHMDEPSNTESVIAEFQKKADEYQKKASEKN